MSITEVVFPDTLVMYVPGDPDKTIPEQAKQGFPCLESGISDLKGRKFFGVIQGKEYRACVSIADVELESSLPYPTWTIPGGKYRRRKIIDWPSHTEEIGVAFAQLYDRLDVDVSRPGIEYYRSQNELFIMVPIQ